MNIKIKTNYGFLLCMILTIVTLCVVFLRISYNLYILYEWLIALCLLIICCSLFYFTFVKKYKFLVIFKIALLIFSISFLLTFPYRDSLRNLSTEITIIATGEKNPNSLKETVSITNIIIDNEQIELTQLLNDDWYIGDYNEIASQQGTIILNLDKYEKLKIQFYANWYQGIVKIITPFRTISEDLYRDRGDIYGFDINIPFYASNDIYIWTLNFLLLLSFFTSLVIVIYKLLYEMNVKKIYKIPSVHITVYAVILLITINIHDTIKINNQTPINQIQRDIYKYPKSDIYEISFSESIDHELWYTLSAAIYDISDNATLIIPKNYHMAYVFYEVLKYHGNIYNIERLNYSVDDLPNDLEIESHIIYSSGMENKKQYRIALNNTHEKAIEFLLVGWYDNSLLIIDTSLLPGETLDIIRSKNS